jgi:hypothetical protein
VAARGEVNWGFVGGGGVAVLVMYLLLLGVGLRRLAAVAGEPAAVAGRADPGGCDRASVRRVGGAAGFVGAR